MVKFGPLAAEIVSLVWGTPCNFNGFRILAALLHGTLVVGVSQTAALNRGRHLYSAGRPSRWALAHISSSMKVMEVNFVVTDPVRGNVLVDAIEVGRGVGVTVAAGVVVGDVRAAAAIQKRREVAVEPEEVGLGAGTSQKEVARALVARLGAADQAAARSLRETDPTVVKSARGAAQTVATDQRRVHQGVLRRQKGAVLEAVMIVRKVALQARKKLPEVVLQVVRSRAKVDQEVPRVQRKVALLVAANLSSLVRMAERVAVVRQVEKNSQTEKMTVRQNLPQTRGAVVVLVVRLNRSRLIKVVRLVVNLIVSLLLVTGTISMSSILQNIMRIAKWQEVVAGLQGMAKTRTEPLHANRTTIPRVNIRVAVGRPVRRRRLVIDRSLEAQRKLRVEAVLAVVARIDAEVVQGIAARPGALRQVQTEAEREVVASRPSEISQKVVL